MAEAESKRSDGVEVVTVCSPTDSHHAAAVEFLRRGVDVICDKPMTSTLPEATDLVKIVRQSGRLFCLTHNYTGYPMVREARARVAAGDIGAVRWSSPSSRLAPRAWLSKSPTRPSVTGASIRNASGWPASSARSAPMRITWRASSRPLSHGGVGDDGHVHAGTARL